MSVYAASALRRERQRLALLVEHITADPDTPDSISAHVQAAVDALDDATREVVARLDRAAAQQ